MALKPTIYKAQIDLSDLDRDYYNTLNVTLAQHPSETIERMMVRLMAYCLNVHEGIAFTKGLCAVDEPDIWVRSLDDRILLWVDVGEPSFDRIKKASRLADEVIVYSFNSKSNTWWEQSQKQFCELNVTVHQFDCEAIAELALLVQRTMEFTLTITGGSLYVSFDNGECNITTTTLQEAS